MIEIDHTALPPPEPARAILASHLLGIEEMQRTRFSSRGERIKTECGEIDDYMLGGGCERGIILGISAEAGESRLISLHFLVTVLLSHLSSPTESSKRPSLPPKTKATIVDTTGSFPVPLLAKILKSRVLAYRSKTARQAVETRNYAANEDGVDVKGVDDDVQRCLEMVAISRVFDVEGLWEVLGEVGRDFSADEGISEDKDEEGIEVIIIDNMTQLINELFARKEKGEAHTLVATLSRILHTLTHTNNILTILHNTTITTKSFTTDASNPNPNPFQTASRKEPNQNPQPMSIFPSNPLKPALGQIFSQFPDLHLLMSQLPKTRQDAERLYGEDESNFAGVSREVGYCYVVEVLKDEAPNVSSGFEKEVRFGEREQRWAAVDLSLDGLKLVNAFMGKENMRGLGLEREKGRLQDVGNVAKMYGFGGRSV